MNDRVVAPGANGRIHAAPACHTYCALTSNGHGSLLPGQLVGNVVSIITECVGEGSSRSLTFRTFWTLIMAKRLQSVCSPCVKAARRVTPGVTRNSDA